MRIEGWDQRLVEAIAAHQARAFAWGEADCGALFADVVMAVTGEDPLAEFRPWGSEQEALRRLAAAGHDSVLEAVAARFDEIVPVDARRGDVGYPEVSLRLSFPAVVVGAVAVSRDEAGWVVLPRSRLLRCFKVG